MPKIFKKRYKPIDRHGFADGVVTFFRHIVTILLLWLRIPLLWILSAVSVLAFVGWIFALLVNDGTQANQSTMTWGMFIISVGSFALMYAYDSLLSFVSPDGLIVEAGY